MMMAGNKFLQTGIRIHHINNVSHKIVRRVKSQDLNRRYFEKIVTAEN